MSIQVISDKCFQKLEKLNLNTKEYVERLNKELKIIEAQNMSMYFIECEEKSEKMGKIKNSINSLVAFLLGIAIEDPIALNLSLIKTKYEEFPDIDSDFEDEKRDLVKDYLIEKYGKDNVASVIAFGKNKARGTVKDIARVKNIPFEEVNEVTSHFRGGGKPDTIEKAYNSYPEVKAFFDKYEHLRLYTLCRKLEGNVRQASKHASGFVISPIPLNDVVGLMVAKGQVTTCWEEGLEHKELAKIGLIKYDLLGLNTLTIFNKTLKYIKKRTGENINISTLNLYDDKVIDEFKKAHTVGIFQFEKEDIRSLMEKIKISSFEDISATNALNRPGPLDTGMDEVFWKVKNGFKKQEYLHEKLESILKNTYTVILYQEQLIKIVQLLAGMNADKADDFRRVMTKDAQAERAKGTNPLEKFEKEFIQGCLNNNITGRITVQRDIYDTAEVPSTAKDIKILEEKINKKGESYKTITCSVEIADEIWHQMKSFAGYGFNKCIIGSTRIKLKDYSHIKVETLFENKGLISKIPDVMSFDEDGKIINTNRIQSVSQMGVQDIYLLTTKNHKKITCTKNHKIRTDNGWKELGDISFNDKILIMKNAEIFWDEVVSIKYKGKKMTYDVSLEDQTHPYFFANNIGIHNSHSTAYALMAYQSMFLKTYYTKEFMSVLLSCTPNSVSNADSINYFINYIDETRRMGIQILPPDINKSEKEFTIEGDSIRSGLSFIKGVASRSIDEILQKRPFKNTTDFLFKTNSRCITKTVFYALVNCGALDCFLTEGENIQDRYKFINVFSQAKSAKRPVMISRRTLLEAVELESEVCGGEIFNSSMKAFNIIDLNNKFDADEKIMDFKNLDKISIGRTMRVFGRVEKFYSKNVGFLTVSNSNEKKTFMMWAKDLAYLDRNENMKSLIDNRAVITFKATRSKDYNGRKSFNIIINSIEKVEEIK